MGADEVTYHGGPVMRTTTVHAIYWAPSGYPMTAGYESAIDGFFQNVSNASGRTDNDYSVAAQYGDTSGPGAYHVTFGGSVVDTDPYPANGCTDGPLPVCLTDAQLQTEIDRVISAHGLHAGLTNEFFIFTPPEVGSCFDDQGFYCAFGYYCAYHSYFTSTLGNGNVIYATEPYGSEAEAPGSCNTGPWPSGDDTDPEMDLISHEEIESTTDPLLNGWYDSGFQEVGDKCIGNFGAGGGSNEQIGTGQYYLQEEWSNTTFDPSTAEQGSCAPEDMPQLVLNGTGDGTVSGAACSGDVCDLSGDLGSTLSLTAQPAAGSTFEGWQGDCSGTGACNVTVTRATSVIARFHTGLPAGWAEEPLQSPAGDPLPDFDADPRYSFFKVAESADGSERAITLHHEGGFCSYGSDNGDISLERQTSAGWVADGTLTPPVVAGEMEQWSSCADWGENISFSANGSTLLASQDMVPTFDGFACAAFVYERGPDGWTPAATLFPPGVGGAGSPTTDGCDYFGTSSVLSADGMRAAVLSDGRVDIYVRGASGWSLDQHVVLPSGDNCGATIVPSGLAISGDGSRLLVGDPDCNVNGVENAGRVYDFERAGPSWSLGETIDAVSGADQFGGGLAISEDGNTAAIAIQDNSDLPSDSGAVWVYEHTQTGWQQRVRLTATTPEFATNLTCPQVSSDGSTIVCSAYDTVGLDPGQGSVYVFRRPGASWTSAPTPLRLFADDGHAQDRLGTAEYQWLTTGLAVSPTSGDIATTIAAHNVGLNGANQIGYEFTTGPVVRSFSPAQALAGAQVTITGANFANASAVTFDGVPASSFTVDSPTEITATAPPTAGIGSIGVTTAKGRGWSPDSFGPMPSIGSLAPDIGIAGTRVTITGTNLLGTTDVEFAGSPAASFSVDSPTRVTAVLPAAATTGELTLATPAGTATSSDAFQLRPLITALVPRWAAATTRLHVEGTNLVGVSSVRVAGVNASFVVASPNEIAVRIPKTARGGHVVVTAANGRAVSQDRFLPIPAITSIAPRTVSPGGRFSIVGSNLGGVYQVVVHGRSTHFRVVTPTLIVVTVPRHATSGRVFVRAWGGPASSPTRLRVR